MTRVRIIRPIMETPSNTPEATATMAVSAATVGTKRPWVWSRTVKLTVSNNRVWAMDATKKVRPNMNSMVSACTSWSRPCKVNR
jgi:hypothetical protein